jgi:plasmid stabilization system protein ParE
VKIEWTEPSLADIESIRDFIRKDSEHYAIRFAEKIIEAVEDVARFPKMGRKFPEAEEDAIRELLLHNYRIMYRKPGAYWSWPLSMEAGT